MQLGIAMKESLWWILHDDEPRIYKLFYVRHLDRIGRIKDITKARLNMVTMSLQPEEAGSEN